GILTNIGSAHSEFFHDQQEKLVEKLKLFKNAHCLVYCNDNLQIADELKKDEYAAIRKFSWGSQPDSYFKIGSKVVSNHHTLVEVNGQNIDIPFTDAASYENALNATAMLFLMGYSFQQVNHKLSQLTPVNMRLEIKEAINQSIIINDTYSLDLYSLRIALDFLHSQTQLSKKTLIISDFEQVGRLNEQDYREIGNLIEKNQINKMIAVGNDFYAHRTLFSVETQYFYQKTNDLIADIDRIGLQQEVVLIKGARSFGFEKLVNLLQCKTHQTVLNVNLSAIIHNLNYYRNLIKPSTKMVAVVKAMSYGLGDAELINELIYHHIDYLAVAYTDEGIRLRNRNIKTPIIVLGAEAHSFEMMIRYSLEPEIYNFYYLEQLGNILALHPDIKSFNIHIKLDTGMHRLGFNEKDISRLVNLISATPKLKIASIFSHLAAAEDEKEDTFTLSQIALFDRMSTKIKSHFQYPILRHILNSAGISRFPEAQFDMVRLGIGLYGFSGVQKDIPYLQHAATLKTIITQIKTIEKGATIGYNRSYRTEKEMKIAIIPIGYADGYPRELSNGVGQVLVHHTLVSIVGKICMDMCMIDVTGLDVSEGDEVIVYGSENSIATIAERTHRIPYEFLTSISPRVPRIYVME
ncbi:MAG: alanine racemase, partial [Bacteroidales bacterium]